MAQKKYRNGLRVKLILKESCVDAAIAAVLSELHGWQIKLKAKNSTEGFSLLLIGFGKTLVFVQSPSKLGLFPIAFWGFSPDGTVT